MGAPDLVFYPDDRPGITRRRAGRGWSYRAPDGATIADAAERARIEALAVPPAYEGVWISPRPRGHLQATGHDTRGRKQYRYHADWAAWRAAVKFDALPAFGERLPALRRRIARALGGEAGERDFAIAAALRLIDRASLRVGSEAALRENGTEGVTTLRRGSLSLGRGGVRLDFRAKGGRRVRRQVGDRTLARALHALADMPGAPVFEWLDGGAPRVLEAQDVNAWLHEATGLEGATAKTFRTWNGSVAALEAAMADPGGATIKRMSEAAAQVLHNTPAIARAAYVHPRVLALARAPREVPAPVPVPGGPAGLRRAERTLLGLLA